MPSRRDLITMTPDEMRAFVDAEKTLIIVSNGPGGFSHPMPMWFWRDDQDRFCCTTFRKSQKVLNWQRDPKATLLVEAGEEYQHLKGVVIYARTEIIDDVDAVADTLVRINTRGIEPSAEQIELIRSNVMKTADKRVLLRFVPEKIVSWNHEKLGGKY